MGQEPDHQTADQYDRKEILRELVGDLLCVTLVILCRTNSIDDPAEDSVAAELLGHDFDHAVFIECSDKNLITDGLIDRH